MRWTDQIIAMTGITLLEVSCKAKDRESWTTDVDEMFNVTIRLCTMPGVIEGFTILIGP